MAAKMYLFLFFLTVFVLFGDETFGAPSLAADYGNWKQNFYIKFNNDSYIVTYMYPLANQKAKDVAKKYPKKYDYPEKKAAIQIVNLYTQEHPKRDDLQIYNNVNKQLRNPSHCNGNVWLEYAGLLHRAIDTLCPNDPKKCTYKKVYRGTKQCDEVDYCDNMKERQVPFKGFMSSSTKATLAYEFSVESEQNRNGYFFYIRDTRGLRVKKFSAIPKESEVLIPANTVFQISGILKSSNSDYQRDRINERLKAHGVNAKYIIDGEKNAKVYARLDGGQTAMYGSYAAVVCKCGLTFPNLSIVMIIFVMVKVIL